VKKGAYILTLLAVAVATTGLYHLVNDTRVFDGRQSLRAVPGTTSPVDGDRVGNAVQVEIPTAGTEGVKETARQSARILIEKGRFEEAANLLRREVALAPRNRALLIDLARVLVWSGRPEEAIQYYRQALGDPI